MQNVERVGRLTSSNIFKICEGVKGFTKKGETYINGKIRERKLGRCMDVGAYSQSMAWGELMEHFCVIQLGYEYKFISKQTDLHPIFGAYWSGSKDLIVPNVKISDIKSYYMDNFTKYTDVLLKQDVELLKKEFPKEYWQLISNGLINGVSTVEAISYMPYESELLEIRRILGDTDFFTKNELEPWKYRFIYEKPMDELNFIPDGTSGYKNVNKYAFEIPEADQKHLENRVAEAAKIIDEHFKK